MSMSPKLTTKIHPDFCNPIDSNNCCVTMSRSIDQRASTNSFTVYPASHDKKIPPKVENNFLCMKMPQMETLSKLFAEFIATGLLMFGGCAGGLPWGKSPTDMYGAVSFGLVVLMLVQTYGAVSGAHLNPAVTLAALIYKLISLPMAICYFAAQMLGAIVGYGALKALTPDIIFGESAGEHGFCASVLNSHLSPFQGFMFEFIATLFLISLCCSVWDPRNSANQDSIAIKFGAAITILSFVFGPYTGCSMNPARTFAPAFWNWNFAVHWIYWAGPLLSAVVTSLTYKIIFSTPNTANH